MILLRCPKFLRCLTADAGNFDRGHSLTSLPLPLAALGSLPTSPRVLYYLQPSVGATLAVARGRGRAPPLRTIKNPLHRADRVVRPYNPIRRGRCLHRPDRLFPAPPAGHTGPALQNSIV